MPTIICNLKLGLREQEVFIRGQKYHNKQTLETFKVPTEKLSEFIANTQDVNQVVLQGPIDYVKKIKENTQKMEKTKYSKIKTNFTFI